MHKTNVAVRELRVQAFVSGRATRTHWCRAKVELVVRKPQSSNDDDSTTTTHDNNALPVAKQLSGWRRRADRQLAAPNLCPQILRLVSSAKQKTQIDHEPPTESLCVRSLTRPSSSTAPTCATPASASINSAIVAPRRHAPRIAVAASASASLCVDSAGRAAREIKQHRRQTSTSVTVDKDAQASRLVAATTSVTSLGCTQRRNQTQLGAALRTKSNSTSSVCVLTF